eukprot:5894283-Prymnesium_polylepis.1
MTPQAETAQAETGRLVGSTLLATMDGSALPHMRAGLGSGQEESSAAASMHFIRTSIGLLRVFSAEAVKTAGKYAIAHCRKS